METPIHEAKRTSDTARGWPERIIELGAEWRQAGTDERRRRVLSDIWLLLNASLFKYLRIHAARLAPVDTEDLRDIASQKSLGLLEKLERGAWVPDDVKASQLCSFVSSVARNGLVDHIKLTEGRRRLRNARTSWAASRADGVGSAPSIGPDRSSFVDALLDCVFELQPRVRLMWYLRVMLELSSRGIARHPGVRATPQAVDVALGRCRKRIKDCMGAKGFLPEDMPPGTFTALWEAFHPPGALPGERDKRMG